MRCLESLSRDSFSGKRTVFLIDNAQSLGRSLAARLPSLDIEIDRPARNLGFAEGCARGISLAAASGADFILLLNNDAVVESSCLDLLVKAATDSPATGLLSPHIVSMTKPPRPWYVGGAFSLWSGIPVQARRSSDIDGPDSPREVDYATGCAMLIRPAVVRSVGSLDARLFAYCEDLDFSLRARNAGFSVLVVPRARVRHAVADSDRLSQSIYYSTRNLLEVVRRHGTWYHWIGIVPNFLVRWVGFFAVLACVRGRPEFLRALASGVVDFARGRLGERSRGRRAAAAPAEAPE
jgi:GT2 family glycosyltransferase